MNIIDQSPAEFQTRKQNLDFRSWLDTREAFRRSLYKPKKRRTATTEYSTFLRSVISRKYYGSKTEEGIRTVSKENWLAAATGPTPRLNWKFSNTALDDHLNNLATLYFVGNDIPTEDRTLVCIDIDVLKALGLGSTAGAWAFARYLQSLFPGLYCEPSTNGKGVHCFFLLRKLGYSAKQVNPILRKLQQYLRQLSAGFDIELVEVKGTLPEITWENRCIQGIKFGQLAKLPRRATEKELSACVLRLAEIDQLELEVVESPKKITLGGGSNPFVDIEAVGKELDLFREDGEEFAAKYPATIRHGKTDRNSVKVTGEDWAIFLYFQKFAKENPNENKENPNQNGTNPRKRIEAFWGYLVEAGLTDRCFSNHRWKFLRDTISELGQIDWEDHEYVIGGYACKWSISAELFSALSSRKRETISCVGACLQSQGIHPHYLPKLIGIRPKIPDLRAAYPETYEWAA